MTKVWRVEIDDWPELADHRRRDLLQVAGDLGGEWWSGGGLAFESKDAAFDCLDDCRQRGHRCRLVLVVRGGLGGPQKLR